ncbi:MAG TPA: sigma-70 family RNA polymerase sigma factor [Verrucomicrobiae bacterium]|nr:sigma-70 family RNA polymerase sigma factor [Verrucomicrobiae bacterium]
MPNDPQVSSFSDGDLVRGAQGGDKRAFIEIVARYQTMVCGIALGILKDFALSEDAGQEVFLTAWRKIYELREPHKLRPWLSQIARNAARRQFRSRKQEENIEDYVILHDKSPGPYENAASEEEKALVLHALGKLPEIYRVPLVLYYSEGKSARLVAEALQISEDAVRQRLARGREACREQISGMLEAVLTRTHPSPVFTVAVAVAIGALAAPATVAAAAFAAKAGASAVASTTTTTSFVSTFMSTSKGFLVSTAAAAVICVPLGYHIANKPVSKMAAQEVSVPLPPQNTIPRADPFESSALFAEWRELHLKYGTNAESMPTLYKAIDSFKDLFHKQALHAALVSEWALVDPAGGISFLLKKQGAGPETQQLFREWLAHAPAAAVAGVQSGGSGWESLARACLKDIAKVLPERVQDIASQLPKPENGSDKSIREAFTVLAENRLDFSKRAAEATTGPNREEALEGVATVWGKTDLNATISWAKALPEGVNRDEVIRMALIGKAAVDPAGALESVGLVPSGGKQNAVASTTGARVLNEAGTADFDGTLAWLTSHPGRLSGQDLEGLVGPVTQRLNADPVGFLQAQAGDGSLDLLLPALGSALLNGASGLQATVWDWLKTQPDGAAIQSLKAQVINSSAWQDPSLAMSLVSDLPNNSEGDKQIKDLAERLFNGGWALDRFDQLFPTAPERLRTPLVEAAFSLLPNASVVDYQAWVDRLQYLPESGRVNGAESLALAWGQKVPSEAITWASSLPPGDVRSAASGAITSGWATQDPLAAAAWVSSLPQGPDRDHGAEALVGVVADRYPTEAWQWVLSINDPAERDRAATQAVRVMAVKDPSTARQWIDSGPFTAQFKTELQASFVSLQGQTSTH